MGAHALDQQTIVLKTAAASLGEMGNAGGGSINPAGMMTGMMMGGAMGGQMAGMMNQMGNTLNQAMNTPPPSPQLHYMLNVNGQNMGPYDIQQLQQLVQIGQLTKQTYVWKQGMQNWELAGTIQELSVLWGAVPPPPPAPEMPPAPPSI